MAGEKIKGGATTYGEVLGVLMLDTKFPRIIGDIGNAATFDFAVRYKVVKNATPDRVAQKTDTALLEPFIVAAKELAAAGVNAITTSCGFLALWQKELAAAVKIPVFTSSLLQAPWAAAITAGRPVGIVTANQANLSAAHLEAVGITGLPIVVAGLDKAPSFKRTFLENRPELDLGRVEGEVSDVVAKMLADNPKIGSLVFECTNLPPFAPLVRRQTGLPVFDISTLCYYIAGTFGESHAFDYSSPDSRF